jgi:hypothetical protein
VTEHKPIDDAPLPPPQSPDHDHEYVTWDIETALHDEVRKLIDLEVTIGRDGRRAAARRVIVRLKALQGLLK